MLAANCAFSDAQYHIRFMIALPKRYLLNTVEAQLKHT